MTRSADRRPPGPPVRTQEVHTAGRRRSDAATRTVPKKVPESGWHWDAWLCEFAGTAVLLAGGLSAIILDFGPTSPVAPHLPSTSARLLLTGLLFAGTGSLVALSPIGRMSGAHLNPAVTIAFWTQGKVHPHDVAGYVIAQLFGALTATACLRLAWGRPAQVLHLGATQPRHGIDDLAAASLEAVMTASLVLMILFMTSSVRTARWTPLGNWLLVLRWCGVVRPTRERASTLSVASPRLCSRRSSPICGSTSSDLSRVRSWPPPCSQRSATPTH